MKPKSRERDLQKQLADYLILKYPTVLFHSDIGSGIRLPIKLASEAKALNGGRRGWPDMFIAVGSSCEACGDDVGEFGLFLELKAEGTRLKKKNGDWASPHFAEQAAVLDELRRAGYKAEFAVGFSEARVIIDEYLERHLETL